MMSRLRWVCVFFVLRCGAAQAAEPFVLHTEMEAEAVMKWSADGKEGICPEILRALSRRDARLQFAWKDYPVPQKRLVVEVEQGSIDFACGLGRTPERERQLVIAPVALYDDALVAAVRKGDALVLGDLADLKKLPPSDVILLTYGARLAGRLAALGIHQIDDGAKRPGENLEKLTRGRGRVFLYHEPGMAWEIQHASLEDKVEILPVILSVDEHYLMLSRRVPPEVVKRVSDALAQLKGDGTLHNIALHWSPGLRAASRHGASQAREAGVGGAAGVTQKASK